MAYTILVAEDDQSIAELVQLTLTASGYLCRVAPNGNQAEQELDQGGIHLALVDIMLPGLDGYAILELCIQRQIPVIFVTAKTSVMDKVRGLRMGAEDYITKPFDLSELLARVEVALRRIGTKDVPLIAVEEVTVDYGRRQVFKRDQPVTLTPKEYELLVFLLQNPNIAFSRESLLNQVWGYDYYGSTRTVDTHILNLRTKLGLGQRLQTVHKLGYRLEL
jgi:DNA-binding response OmpR family regulator